MKASVLQLLPAKGSSYDTMVGTEFRTYRAKKSGSFCLCLRLLKILQHEKRFLAAVGKRFSILCQYIWFPIVHGFNVSWKTDQHAVGRLAWSFAFQGNWYYLLERMGELRTSDQYSAICNTKLWFSGSNSLRIAYILKPSFVASGIPSIMGLLMLRNTIRLLQTLLAIV